MLKPEQQASAIERFKARGTDAINAAEFSILSKLKIILFNKKTRKWEIAI